MDGHNDNLSRYSFLIMLLLDYLPDSDALTLLRTSSTIKRSVNGYHIKSSLTPNQAETITHNHTKRITPNQSSHIRLFVTRLHDVDKSNLSAYHGLREVKFVNSFDQSIDSGDLPASVISLTFGVRYNQPNDVLPPNLTRLIFGLRFNHSVENLLPSSLTHLEFDGDFNQPIRPHTLPSSITYLKFGIRFNQLLQAGSLPPRLTHLKFGWNYSIALEDDVLPEWITHLELGWRYTSRVKLPPAITHVKFDNVFAYRAVDRPMPCTLTSLVIDRLCDHNRDIPKLPDTIVSLTIPCLLPIEQIPASVRHLGFGQGFNERIAPSALPEHITHLNLGWIFNQLLLPRSVPASVTHLHFGNMFNQPIGPGVLPSGLKHIHFGKSFRHNLEPGVVPDSVTSIIFAVKRRPPLRISAPRAHITYLATLPAAEPRISRWMISVVWLCIWLDWWVFVPLAIFAAAFAMVMRHWYAR